MTDTKHAIEAAAEAILEIMGPVFGTPEYLAKHADRLIARQRKAAEQFSRAAIVAWLEAIAQDGGQDAPGTVEQCMKAVLKSWKHAGVTCSPDLEASELAARAVIATLLSRAKQQQG